MKITKELLTVIKTATKFCGKDNLRPMMTGVHFSAKDGKISVVATDAHILFWWKEKQPSLKCRDYSFTLPMDVIKSLKEGDTIIATNEEDPNVLINGMVAKKLEWYYDERRKLMLSRRYPNYQAVIPSNDPNSLYFEFEDDVKHVVDRIKGCSNSTSKLIDWFLSENRMTAEDLDFEAKASIRMDFKGSFPDTFHCRFRSDKLITTFCLKGEVRMDFSTKHRAFVLHKEWMDGELIRLIMPCFIED